MPTRRDRSIKSVRSMKTSRSKIMQRPRSLFDLVPLSVTSSYPPSNSSPQYPRWIGRRDKRGFPICTFDVRELDSKTMAAYKHSSSLGPNPKLAGLKAPGVVSAPLLRAFAVFDDLTRFIMPLLSAMPDRPDADKPVTKTLIIADITGLDMRQLWNMKRWLQDSIKLLSDNYPEILDQVLVCLIEDSSCFYPNSVNQTVEGYITDCDSFRSQVHRLTSPPSGASSRIGSTQSRPPSWSSCLLKRCCRQ